MHPSEEPSDEVLAVMVAISRDPEQFGELVSRHHARLRGLLRHLARDADLADDLLQQALLTAWQKLPKYRGSGRFAAWLGRIAYRVFLQHARRARLERRLFSAEPLPGAPDCNAGVSLIAQANGPSMQQLLGVCTRLQQEALYMNYVLELTHEEIAGITGQPLGTVKSHIKRGKSAIQASLSEVDTEVLGAG